MKSSQPLGHSMIGCFQLLGFDVLFDEQLKPQILEVNVGLSLSLASSVLDAHVKGELDLQTLDERLAAGVIVGALNVIGVPGSSCGLNHQEDDIVAAFKEFRRAEGTGYVRAFPTESSLTEHVPLFKEIDDRTLALVHAMSGSVIDRTEDCLSSHHGFHRFETPKASKFQKKKKSGKFKSKR